ncbi:MAG: hypothetical protein LBB34_04200 [Holosporales bacterium]|jgi:hypothetical protein|nr:hypothetical protein [Holosporales bacterium]
MNFKCKTVIVLSALLLQNTYAASNESLPEARKVDISDLATKDDLTKLTAQIENLSKSYVDILALFTRMTLEQMKKVTNAGEKLYGEFAGFVIIRLPNGDRILTTEQQLDELHNLPEIALAEGVDEESHRRFVEVAERS